MAELEPDIMSMLGGVWRGPSACSVAFPCPQASTFQLDIPPFWPHRTCDNGKPRQSVGSKGADPRLTDLIRGTDRRRSADSDRTSAWPTIPSASAVFFAQED